MKILLIDNAPSSIIQFHAGLIQRLEKTGNAVTVFYCNPSGKRPAFPPFLHCAYIEYRKSSNRSTGFFVNVNYYRFLKKIISENNFDFVWTFQVKANAFGTLAAKACRVKHVLATIEGIGDPFSKRGIKWFFYRRIITILFRRGFKNIDGIICTNDDMPEFLARHKIGTKSQCRLIYGLGIDLSHYPFSPITNHKNFLMVCRLLKTKGVFEFCEAAKLCKEDSRFSDLTFTLVGPEGDITKNQLETDINNNIVSYAGYSNSVIPFYKDCGCLVLPSYSEGLGMVIVEAMAIGRPAIASDVMGCRVCVKDGYNGFLVPPKNPYELANAITKKWRSIRK